MTITAQENQDLPLKENFIKNTPQIIKSVAGNDVEVITASNENRNGILYEYQITIGKGNRSNKVTNKTVDYKELKKLLCSFEPVKIRFYNKADNNFQENIKHTIKLAKEELPYFIPGHFKPQVRKTENMLFRNAIVLDIDNYSGNIEELERSLNTDLGKYEYLAYSTSSYHPKNPKIRVYLPLKKNVLAYEYEAITKVFVNNLTFKEAIDTASYKPNQCMYVSANIEIIDLPAGITLEKYQPWFRENKGELVNPQEYKSQIIPIPIKSKITESVSNNSPALNLSSEEIEKYLKDYPANKLSYDSWLEVGMALHNYYNGSNEGYKKWDQWSSEDHRYKKDINKEKWNSFGNCKNPVTFLTIIKKINDSDKALRQEEVIARIKNLKPSFNEESELLPIIKSIALDYSDLEAEYYFSQIKSETGIGLIPLRSLFQKEKRKLSKAKADEIRDKIFPLDQPLPSVMFGDYLENGKEVKTTIENLKILFKGYGITVRRNVISRENEILIPNEEYYKETAEESSFAVITSLCEKNNLSKVKHIDSYCTQIASANLYNPILDFIQSKPWDKKSRLQEVCNTIITEDGYSKELKELLFRRWAISDIAAIAEKKGLFAKGVLVFQGKQSKGKTTWFKELVPPEIKDYFLEGHSLDPTNKDSVITAISHWIVELGELESTLKKDISKVKAFISSNKNIVRVPYARKDTKFLRRTVFCGSVNERDFLIDQTGNVRFWAIPVVELKTDDLKKIDLQQFWAEIYEIYKSGERWWLIPDEEEMLEVSNKTFVKSCIYEEAFLEKYKIYIPDNEPGIEPIIKKNPKELLQALGWTQPSQRDFNQMSAALLRLGGTRDRAKKFSIQQRIDTFN